MTYQDNPQGAPLPRLGSLAQSARSKQLKQARWLLIVVGVLTFAANAFFFASAESMVKAEIDKELASIRMQPGMVIDQAKVAELQASATRLTRLVAGGTMALGALFVVFGLFLKSYPVAISVTSLVLYVGAVAGFAILNPATFVKGIIFKVLIIVALAKAVQAAIAYEKEQKAQGLSA